MFQNQKDAEQNTTIIAEGVHVEGNFKGSGPTIIEGSVKGKVNTALSLTVGEHAVIEASVKAGSALVSGKIKGSVAIKDKLHITSTGVIDGDITTKILEVEDGAVINGKINMTGASVNFEDSEDKN